MRRPILSIYIPVYNHGDYLAEALDSVLMQESDYEYEVIVGDDCSTDNSQAILKEYENKYPGVFNIIYRKHNINNQIINNFIDLQSRCRGKYVICLEGDDFWIDTKKIDKQITFLETNPEYIAVAHNCIVVDKDSQPNGEEYPECKKEEYLLEYLFKGAGIMPGQLTTIMHKNYYFNEDDKGTIDYSLTRDSRLFPGDRVNVFTLIMNGKIHCMQEAMSAYRHITSGGSSFSASKYNRFIFERDELLYRYFMNYAENKNEELKLCELRYYEAILQGIYTKQIKWIDSREYIKNINHRISTRLRFLKAIFRKILKF